MTARPNSAIPPGARASAARMPGRAWSFGDRHDRAIAAVVLLAPACVLFFIFVVGPIAQTVRLSLYDWDGTGPQSWIGLGQLHRTCLRSCLPHGDRQQRDLAALLFGRARARPFHRAAPQSEASGDAAGALPLPAALRDQPGGRRRGLRLVLQRSFRVVRPDRLGPRSRAAGRSITRTPPSSR